MLGIKLIYVQGIKTNYLIDTFGNVFNTKLHQFVAIHPKDNSGNNGFYLKFCIRLDNGQRVKLTQSREILKAFKPLDNYEDMEADHIDDNHLNNALNNLQWLTKSDNLKKMNKAKNEFKLF
jgi:hypothetical protein